MTRECDHGSCRGEIISIEQYQMGQRNLTWESRFKFCKEYQFSKTLEEKLNHAEMEA